MISTAESLAQLADVQTRDPLPVDVIHASKRCVIDWLAVAIAGSFEKQALALESGLLDELGHGSSRTLSGHKASMRTAALINGLASHIVEFDDIYAPGTYHPGSPTIAAALSAATGGNKSGLDLIRGIVAGYEVSNRVARALGTDHYRYWHTTGTVGTIGAAAAIASLHGLTTQQTAQALATSTTMAAGLQNAFRGVSEIKPLHAGHAADAGFIAIALAQNAVVAAPDMFEGETGLGQAMSANVDWASAIGTPEEFTILRMTIKNHGCCGHIFPALDGAMVLQKKNGFNAQDVESIHIGGYSATVNVTGNYTADEPASARFCLPFVVASGLVHGSIRLDAYTESRLNDPVVRELMPRISVTLDPERNAVFPAQRSANVQITLKDGRILNHFQPHRVGDPDLPLSDAQLENKFLELTSDRLNDANARILLKELWRLDEQPNLDGLYDSIQYVPQALAGS